MAVKTKKPIESKSYWYILLTVLGVIITAIIADENTKEILGSYVVVLYIADKMVTAYLRSVTDTKISRNPEKIEPEPKLSPVDQALKDEDINAF